MQNKTFKTNYKEITDAKHPFLFSLSDKKLRTEKWRKRENQFVVKVKNL